MSNRGFLKAAIILISASTIINLGYSALSPVFPYLILALKGLLKELPELTKGVIEAHRGAFEFGLFTAAFMITRAPMAGLVGFLSDVFGKKKTILIGMGLYAIVSFGYLLSNDILLFILFRGLQGVASALVWPVAEAYLADISPRWSRGKIISLYTSSMLIAEIVGPGIGVLVYKLYTSIFKCSDVIMALKSPVLFLIISSLASLATLTLIPEFKAGTANRYTSSIILQFKEIISIMKSLPDYIARSLKVIYLNGLINGIAMGIASTIAIVYIIEYVVKDPAYIGLFYIIMSIVALPASLIAGYLSDRVKKRKPFVVFGYVVGRSALFIIPLVRNLIIILILGALMSMVFGLASPIMRALQADLTPDGIRGSVFGFQQFFFNSGAVLGAIVGGYLVNICASMKLKLLGYMLTGYVIPFWIAAVLGLITTVLFILYVKERE